MPARSPNRLPQRVWLCTALAACLAAAAPWYLHQPPPHTPGAPAPASATSLPLEGSLELADRVCARNMLDPTAQWSSCARPPPTPPEPPPDKLPPSLLPCPATLRLVAAVVVPANPEQSLVAIASQGPALLYAAGRMIGEREVIGVREQRAWLREPSGAVCELSMFSPPGDTNTPTRPGPSATPSGNPSSAARTAIRSLGEHRYALPRQLVERTLQNPAQLMRAGRVVPARDGAGMRLFGVRSGGVLNQLGLRNGDVLVSANGHALGSADSALQAYTELRTARSLSLSIMRHGSPVTLRFEIE